jgi:hypothetical protein
VDWAQFEAAQPQLAAVGRRRLIEPGVLLIGTIRTDGTPRISPVEPVLMDGGLWLSMLWGSAKARDLLRDPRILVHGIVTNRDGGDGEFKVRGLARAEDRLAVQQQYASLVAGTLGWDPVPGRFHLFEVDIADVAFLHYDDATGDQFTARWPPPREYVRRGTTPTSLGSPQPWQELIRPER